MSILTPLYTAVYNKLSGSTALTTLLGGTAIYNKIAPDSASLPYVVMSYQAGGPDNMNPSGMENSVMFIRAYASTDAKARQIDGQIDTLLRGAALTMTGGYTNFWSAREEDIDSVETPPNGKHIFMAGGFYRFRNDK